MASSGVGVTSFLKLDTKNRETMTSASTMTKHALHPTASDTRPPIVGPRERPMYTEVVLMPMAHPRRSRGNT